MNEQPFLAPTTDLMNGLLPAFEFVSLIMSNADQAVYLANQKSLDRHVAIKLHSPSASADEDFKEAFEVMARQMAQLNHVNLIGVYNSGVVDGMLYLVMEFVPSKPLQQLLKGNPLRPAHVAGMMDGICSGLACAHHSGILHGGLSPLNVLVTREYELKVGNFGFLAVASSDDEDSTSRYMGPELLSETGELSPLADVYSLGVLLYELYTGKPFVIGTVPPELSTLAGRKVLEVIKKATAHDPTQRYASVEEFQSACLKTLPTRKTIATGKPKVATKVPKSPGGLRSPASPMSPAVAPPPQSPKAGHQLRMLVHFITILILCYAIYIVWNRLEHKKIEAAKAAEKQQLEQLQKKEKLEAEKVAARALQEKRLQDLQNRIDQNKPPDSEVRPETQAQQAKPENPYEPLNKLRDKLLAGDRSKMPGGTQRIGDSHYLLIDHAMSWVEASGFAESYGAYLAVPSKEASVQWLQSQFGVHVSDAIWIGAAKSGRDDWVLADGSIWKPSGLPATGGDFVALSKDGKLQLGSARTRYPFVIQWKADGSNPGALVKLLQRTRISISLGRPIYPPGTLVFGVRHYLYVAQPMTWDRAATLAKAGGGHLLVVSGVAEAFNLDKMIGELSAPDGIWLGGRCQSNKWSWVTNEQWDPKKWRGSDAPKLADAALAVEPGMGWNERDLLSSASGFLIEWSSDASNAASEE